MEKVTKPIVRTLASGSELVMKQMQARAGDLLPKHLASLESLVFVHEGECQFNMDGETHVLRQGEGIVVPAQVTHQIRAVTDFKGVHVMPKAITFEYFS